ncbi:hypothetical protein F8388_008353 [Cannabis sativa]|uniref:Pentatricopeptide repeat-containing protein n=1 Tax=Cannabis sativa TaxID=3483 RepID=A0A7J6EN60_CANSA|nr:hypothetical protein F8388_008353 [Cannabis sativa]
MHNLSLKWIKRKIRDKQTDLVYRENIKYLCSLFFVLLPLCSAFSNGVQINALLLFCCCFKGTIFKKIFKLGCKPNAVTFGTLINGLCRTGNASIALELHEQMACGKDHGDGFKCTPNLVWYGAIIDGLCKEGLMEKAQQLFLEMKEKGVLPDVVVYSSLMHGLCYADKWEEAKALSKLLTTFVSKLARRGNQTKSCIVPRIL